MKNRKIFCVNCDFAKPLESRLVKHFNYVESGLKYVFIKNGVYQAQCPKCKEEYTTFRNLDFVHKSVFEALLRKSSLLKPDEVRFIRKHLGYGSEEFAKLLGYGREAYSRLENGKEKITEKFDRSIRFAALSKPDPDRNYDIHDAIKTNSLEKIKDIIIDISKLKPPTLKSA